MTIEAKIIEQLWYTWSRVGLGTNVGFRVRAASEGLQDILSARVQSLDPYLYYSLPRDRDRSTALGNAPVCLMFLNIGNERVLLHKVYTGQDDLGRSGVFFIHLLMGLPETFSARDALNLWQSDFWQHSDKKIDQLDKHLERVSPSELKRWTKDSSLNADRREQVQKYLPYIIQAYLGKNLQAEKKRCAQSRLYIAASDDDVALLIAKLIGCLPPQLVKTLTFSTYESRIHEPVTEIVGRCWYSVPEAEQDPDVEQLLPLNYEQELAINCYTEDKSTLDNHPCVYNDPRIEQCAQDATSYILSTNQEYQELLDAVKDIPDLTVEQFLSFYGRYIHGAQSPTKEAVEQVLSPRTIRECEFSARMLSRQSYQRKLMELALFEPGWWQIWHRNVMSLRKRSASIPMPMLGNALSAVARYVLTEAVNAVQRAVAPGRGIATDEVMDREATIFALLIDLMKCAAPPEDDPDVWRTLLQKLGVLKGIDAFFLAHWDMYGRLMQLFAVVLSVPRNAGQPKNRRKDARVADNNKLIEPLLRFIFWGEFGAFLAFHLPLDWNEMVIKRLVYDKNAHLSEKSVQELEQIYHPDIASFFGQLTQEQRRWSTAMAFFELLATKSYGKKVELFLTLFNSPMGTFENTGDTLFKKARLTAGEEVPFLKVFGPQYLPLTSHTMARTVLTRFKKLAEGDYQQEKLEVLFSWLASPPLIQWFSVASEGEYHLTSVLKAASLNGEESGRFFQLYGKKYIPLYPASPFLLELFERYASREEPWRIICLELWLACKPGRQTLDQLLNAAHLYLADKVGFLQKYGEYYLTLYPASSVLLGYVQEFLRWLQTADLQLFKGKDPSPTENLLQFLYDCSSNKQLIVPSCPSQLFYDWWTLVQFVREPTLLGQKSERVVTCVSRLFSNNKLARTPTRPQPLKEQKPTYLQLISELVAACIAENKQAARIITMLHSNLPPKDMLSLLYELAANVNEGLRQRYYAKTLLIPCVQAAGHFQNAFSQKNSQKIFLQSFLNTLLDGIDEKVLAWLCTHAWPVELSTRWKNYAEQQAFHTISEPSWVEQYDLRYEWWIAYGKRRKALVSKNERRIVQVCIDYMTTFTYYKGSGLSKIDEIDLDGAWNRLSQLQVERQWFQIEQPQTHAIQSLMLTSTQPPHAEPPLSPQDRKMRNEAFSEMKKALRQENIGEIVRLATAYGNVLGKYCDEVPEEWRVQAHVAWEFFSAWRDAEQRTDLSKEQALIDAAKAVVELMQKSRPVFLLFFKPTPLFTAHEIRRILEARQFLAQQEALLVRGMSREQILEELQKSLPERSQQSSTSSSHGKAPEKHWWNIGGWFKRTEGEKKSDGQPG